MDSYTKPILISLSGRVFEYINSFQNIKILDISEFKAFAEDSLSVVQFKEFVFDVLKRYPC